MTVPLISVQILSMLHSCSAPGSHLQYHIGLSVLPLASVGTLAHAGGVQMDTTLLHSAWTAVLKLPSPSTCDRKMSGCGAHLLISPKSLILMSLPHILFLLLKNGHFVCVCVCFISILMKCMVFALLLKKWNQENHLMLNSGGGGGG